MGSKLKGFFDINGSFFSFMEKIMWVIIVNVLLLVTCMPIITIGASAKAMYATMFRIIKEKKADFFETYFTAFFKNLGTSILLTLSMLAAFAVCIVDIMYFFVMGTTMGYIMMGISILIALAVLMIVSCAFPILARSDGKYKETLRETIAFISMYPKSAFGVLLTVVVLLALTVLVLTVPELMLFIYLLFMSIGLIGLVVAYIFEKALMEDEEDEEL